MTRRIARCSCGALQVSVTGEPDVVIACHCLECQRRTGAPFGVGAYFRRSQVEAHGPATQYRREGQDGRTLTTRFCPTCGSTVYWEAEFRPDHVGVALGAFGDGGMPPPTRSVWEQSRHPWIEFTHEHVRLPRQSPPAR
jgi:hypothetical protein